MAGGTETPSLEDRVTALEECARNPLRMYVPKWEPLTEAQEAELRESLAKVAKEMPLRVVLPQPLSPDEVRQLLRECVTVVKPGETLVIMVPLTWTPDQLARYARTVDDVNRALDLPIKTLVVPAEELAVVEAPP